jgi:hypothetical protein
MQRHVLAARIGDGAADKGITTSASSPISSDHNNDVSNSEREITLPNIATSSPASATTTMISASCSTGSETCVARPSGSSAEAETAPANAMFAGSTVTSELADTAVSRHQGKVAKPTGDDQCPPAGANGHRPIVTA